LRQGSEVHKADPVVDPRLAQVGSYATVVDWDSLPNSLLGITIEGGKKFRVLSSFQQKDNLHMAEVEWIEPEACVSLPEQSDEMKTLLLQLLDHPHIARLKLDPVVEDVGTLGHLLAQLLPIEESLKFELLKMTQPVLRMERLIALLDQYSQ
jgi:Lon protease-like protein